MLVLGCNGRWLTEIYFHPLAHDSFAIQDLSYPNGRGFVEERHYDAAERFQWCPGMYRRRDINEVSDGLEVVGAKDFGVL